MNSTDPSQALTLFELIDEGKYGELQVSTTTFVNRIDNMIIPTTSVFDSYMDFIIPITQTITLTEEEYAKYRMRPKLLSYTLYGTVELWFLLLKINRMQSSMEFNKRELKVIKPSQIDLINKIMVFNNERLEKSRLKVE